MQKQAKFSLSIFILSLLPLISVLGNSMFIPILPNIQFELGLSTYEAGLLLTSFSIPAACVIPLIGVLADRFGRRKVVLAALILVMLGNILAVMATTFQLLLSSRIVQGLGAGGTASLAMIMIGDRYEDRERSKALGILEVSNGIGKIMSPIIGSVFLIMAWVGSFYLYFAIALLAFIGVTIYIEKGAVNEKRPSFREYLQQLSQVFVREWKWLVPIFIASGASLFVLYGMLFFLSYEISTSYHVKSLVKGCILAIPLAGLTISSYLSGKRVGTKLNRMKQALVIGMLLLMTSFSLLIFTTSLFLQIIWLAIAASGIGLFLPAANTAITSSVSKQERGLVVSIYNMTRFFGVAFGPTVFATWMNTPVDMHFFALFAIGISLVFLISFWSCIPVLKKCSMTI